MEMSGNMELILSYQNHLALGNIREIDMPCSRNNTGKKFENAT